MESSLGKWSEIKKEGGLEYREGGGDSTHTAECMLDGSADSLLLTEARVSVSGCSSPHSIVLEREEKRTSCREEKGVNAQTHTFTRVRRLVQ